MSTAFRVAFNEKLKFGNDKKTEIQEQDERSKAYDEFINSLPKSSQMALFKANMKISEALYI